MLTIRILRFDVDLMFPRLVYMTLVMLDTPANARLQRCVREGVTIFIRSPVEW